MGGNKYWKTWPEKIEITNSRNFEPNKQAQPCLNKIRTDP